ncbi:hypothetical protein AB1Y20_002532 [Prymnesium parvum]|uniref:Sulfotransferase n=1 Tax=Prymnesium parvum TaxID=97485 RepID=A0AB34J880_PRYPA
MGVAASHPEFRGRLNCSSFEWTSIGRETLVSHKTGVWLALEIEGMFAHLCGVDDFHSLPTVPRATPRRIVFLRDPIYTAVSGMLYHRDGAAEASRDWGDNVPMLHDPQFTPLLHAIHVGELPSPLPGTTFHHYLRRLSDADALKAYMVYMSEVVPGRRSGAALDFRGQLRWLVEQAAAVRIDPKHHMGLCLDAFSHASESEFQAAVDAILQFWRIPKRVHRAFRVMAPRMRQEKKEDTARRTMEGRGLFAPEHATSSASRTNLHNLVRQVDMESFGGVFYEASRRIKCQPAGPPLLL